MMSDTSCLPRTLSERFGFWSLLAAKAAAKVGTHVYHRAMQCMEIWGGSHAANTDAGTPGLDVWVYSRPFEGAKDGGDVHYVSLCGGGIITRFILADVAGHGAKVADLAKSLRDLMRQNINRKSHARLVTSLNREFTEMNRQGRFATAVIVTYLAHQDQLTVSNAGHPQPLIFRAVEKAWSKLEQSGEGRKNLPLGIDESIRFSQFEFALNRGDLILLYTDGLIEMTDASGRQLGLNGLLSLVENLDPNRPEAMSAALIERLDGYRGETSPNDDLTFLLLHHNANNPPRQSLRQKLDVYAKVFGLKPV